MAEGATRFGHDYQQLDHRPRGAEGDQGVQGNGEAFVHPKRKITKPIQTGSRRQK
jgi:hypothetical protein